MPIEPAKQRSCVNIIIKVSTSGGHLGSDDLSATFCGDSHAIINRSLGATPNQLQTLASMCISLYEAQWRLSGVIRDSLQFALVRENRKICLHGLFSSGGNIFKKNPFSVWFSFILHARRKTKKVIAEIDSLSVYLVNKNDQKPIFISPCRLYNPPPPKHSHEAIDVPISHFHEYSLPASLSVIEIDGLMGGRVTWRLVERIKSWPSAKMLPKPREIFGSLPRCNNWQRHFTEAGQSFKLWKKQKEP